MSLAVTIDETAYLISSCYAAEFLRLDSAATAPDAHLRVEEGKKSMEE